MLSLFGLFFAGNLYLGFGSDKVLMNSLTQSGYYDGVNEDVNEEIKELASNRNIPEEVLENAIPSEKIMIDSTNYINKALDGQYENINTDQIEEKIRDQVTTYLTEQNVDMTSTLQTSINSMVTASKIIYKNKIEFKFIDYYKDYQKKLTRALNIIIPVTVVMIGLCSFCLMKMYRSKHKGVRFISYGLLGSIYTSIAANLLFNPIKGMDITPDYYKEFLEMFINKCRMQNYLLIMIQVILFAVLLYCIKKLKKSS
jgi:hypothetical protein